MSKNKIKLVFMLAFCILIIIGVILMITMIKSIRGNESVDNGYATEIVDNNVEGNTNIPIPSDMVFPTPEPSSELGENGQMLEIGTPPETLVIMSGTSNQLKEEEEAASTERYYAVKKDVSWEQAKENSDAMKDGHLVTISSAEELKTVIQYCINNDIDICWIGCHREDGKYIWENNEDIDINGLYAWGNGEPSYTDQGIAEDYIMLWWMNGKWCLNDSENDPIARFPKDYQGKLGYIVEFNNR